MIPSAGEQTRREFLQSTAAASAAIAAPFVLEARGALERVRVGFIGIGNRGSQLLAGFMAQPDVEVAALCDIYEPYLMRDRGKVDARIVESLKGANIPDMKEQFPRPPERMKDFRRLLERKDVDAVCIATPDHWHAIMAIQSMEAGKDVYVEKPLTITILEGRKMVEAAARTRRTVQVGLNRRGSTAYREAFAAIRGGKIGKVSFARAYRINNMAPHGIGRMQPSEPPPGFDWDAWLGPRAKRPFQFNIAPYKFRWWQDYSTQMGNWGVHYMDAVRWLIGEEAPSSISAHGGRFVVDDDRTIPDTMEVTFEFASGRIVGFGIYEASHGTALPAGEIEIRGSDGVLYADDRGYSIVPARAGQFQKETKAGETIKWAAPREDITNNLIRNFVDAVRLGKALDCPLETGHRSTCFAHLANIALATKTRLDWDARAERFTNSASANKLLHYEYRAPWKL